MSINYIIDKNRRLIMTEVSGELTLQKTLEYFVKIQQDNGIPDDAVEIVDFDKVDDFVISYSDMKAITQSYQAAKSEKKILATIFLSRTSIAFGIARMLQALHEIANEKHIVLVVRSSEELEQRIKELRLNQQH